MARVRQRGRLRSRRPRRAAPAGAAALAAGPRRSQGGGLHVPRPASPSRRLRLHRAFKPPRAAPLHWASASPSGTILTYDVHKGFGFLSLPHYHATYLTKRIDTLARTSYVDSPQQAQVVVVHSACCRHSGGSERTATAADSSSGGGGGARSRRATDVKSKRKSSKVKQVSAHID